MPLTPATPSDRQKKLNEAFGGLGSLTGEATLRARRKAERAVQRAQEQKLGGRDFAARVTGRVIGEALAKALGNGSDAELDRAQLVDEAVAAAQDATGFEVPQAQVQEIEGQVRAEGAQKAQQAAVEKSGSIQTTNAFEQQHLLVTNTIRELVSRGLTKEASQLLPNLKAIEDAETKERMQQAELEGKVLSNEDARDGDTKTIVPRSTGEPIAAQVMSDGTARYWDAQEQAEVVIRPGQYVLGQLTGTRSEIEDKELKGVLPILRGMTTTLGIMTDLRDEIVKNPEATSVAGDALALVNRYLPAREMSALKSALAASKPEGFADTKDSIQAYLKDNNINNARQRIMVERLGFALASSRENGKLSVSDVELAMRAFGINERDPDVRLALMDDLVKDLTNQYETIATISPEKVQGLPLYQRAGTFFDGYASAAKRRPSKPLGGPAPGAPGAPDEADNTVAEDALFFNDRGGFIR